MRRTRMPPHPAPYRTAPTRESSHHLPPLALLDARVTQPALTVHQCDAHRAADAGLQAVDVRVEPLAFGREPGAAFDQVDVAARDGGAIQRRGAARLFRSNGLLQARMRGVQHCNRGGLEM